MHCTEAVLYGGLINTNNGYMPRLANAEKNFKK